jgi:excisionase family DNA binding protein
MSADGKSEMLRIGDVAELLRGGRRSICRWSHSGAMPAPVRIGAAVRFRRSEIENWVKNECCRTDAQKRQKGVTHA